MKLQFVIIILNSVFSKIVMSSFRQLKKSVHLIFVC